VNSTTEDDVTDGRRSASHAARASRARRPYEQIVIEDVGPSVGGGHFPVKAIVGETCRVEATVFRHGHDRLHVRIRVRGPGESTVLESPMAPVNPGLDLWQAEFPLTRPGRYRYSVVASTDHFASWLGELRKRVDAGQPDAVSEVGEGISMVERAAKALTASARGEAAALLRELQQASGDPAAVVHIAGSAAALALMARVGPRDDEVESPELQVMADRPRARLGAWYELFVRSQGTQPGVPGTFADAERRLDDIRAMGFDVVYLAPIHPIGRTDRKGPNNRVGAGPSDPGSPWAIGSADGGHTAIEPALGTLDDFDRFVRAADARGMEVALDLAIQCSPDHPWVREHPEWFSHRPDGSIRYAENPPKKYQDIYPINFDTPAWESLWAELRRVVQFWIDHGVRIFRVDNPHTKPVGFWAWLIDEIQHTTPEAIFLAEAFTRPPMMQGLGRRGFSQSYTYFTWRNSKRELTDYLTELTQPDAVRSFRPNFFANTPDILPPILQQGGRPAFLSRLALAATLSPSYGIYSGYELCENEAIPGREEYLNSEKYEIKVRDWNAPGHIKDFITRINAARRDHPALQLFDNIRFLEVGDDNLIAYVKSTPDRSSSVIVVVNLDPFLAHASTVRVPAYEIGVADGSAYEVVDVVTDRTFVWRDLNYVHLDPASGPPVHVLVVRR
jgi:starch synthase (maltosyl-transferring)